MSKEEKVSGKAAPELMPTGLVAKEGENIMAVCHIYASFNDTFVHVTDPSGRETITKVTGGMKVKADRDEASPYAAMLAAQDVVVKCKELGITGLHIKMRDRRQQDQDAGPRRAVGAPRARARRPQDRPHRGRDADPLRLHPPQVGPPRSPLVSAPPAAAARAPPSQVLAPRLALCPLGGAGPGPPRPSPPPPVAC